MCEASGIRVVGGELRRLGDLRARPHRKAESAGRSDGDYRVSDTFGNT